MDANSDTLSKQREVIRRLWLLLDHYYDQGESYSSPNAAATLETLRKELATFVWLIIPRPSKHWSRGDLVPKFRFELISESTKLFKNLMWVATNRELLRTFCDEFWRLSNRYRDECLSDRDGGALRLEYDTIVNTASWMLVKQIVPTDSTWTASRFLTQYDESKSHSCTSNYPLAYHEHRAHCKILIEMFEAIHGSSRAVNVDWDKRLCKFLASAGYSRWNEERMRLVESCYAEGFVFEHIRDYFKHNDEDCLPCRKTLTFLRLAFFEHSKTRLTNICHLYAQTPEDLSVEIRGIQARRIVLLSMCKLSVFKPDLVFDLFLPKMIDLLDELQNAYELRANQNYSYKDEEKFLLPTCTELAFATPFDDSTNSAYICELRFFRDTMEYLRRNETLLFKKAVWKTNKERRERLDFYLEKHDKFDRCCAPVEVDRREMIFQCIDHRIAKSSGLESCPLLDRKPFMTIDHRISLVLSWLVELSNEYGIHYYMIIILILHVLFLDYMYSLSRD